MQRTIVEIQARDEIGLLPHRLAKIIYDPGLRHHLCPHRHGSRGIAIDSFYIENANHEPIQDTARLNALRERLLAAIAPATPEKAESGERKA